MYGAQLAQFVKEEQDIDFTESIFRSDSTTVLYWLRKHEMRHRIFIANRSAKILDVSSAFDWRYIPSAANPADDGIRGYSVYQMTSESRWISGRSFLSKHRSDWPNQNILQSQYVKIVSFPSSVPVVETVGNLKRFSSWNRLIRVIAFCFFFADKCMKRSKDIQLGRYTKAYLHIIQTTQKQDFKAEFFALKKGDDIPSSSRLKPLSPFLDKNNQLRARGRLSESRLLMTSRYPLLLDGTNIATGLLIQHTHELNCHYGPEQTRNILMEYYWILRCPAVIKQTIRHCLPCRQMIEVTIPKMADLPQEKLPKNNKFVVENNWTWFIGPFPAKNNGKLFSRYVLLFTCLVVHLEVSNDLTTDSTINCNRRFVSRRGKPNKFISNCGN